MRYYLADGTLIVRGVFRACSTDVGDGIKNVTSLLTHRHSTTFHPDHEQEIRLAAYQYGLSPSATFGLLTPVPNSRISIFRYNRVTVFITVGKNGPEEIKRTTGRSEEETRKVPYSIQIICIINGDITDQGLLKGLIAVTQAKTLAISGINEVTGCESDAVIIAYEGVGFKITNQREEWIRYIHESILYGIPYTLAHLPLADDPDRFFPELSFHIHSTIGGDRWIEWHKGGCPYYPCHFKGQRCDLCYCPLYPCEDETLGEWTTGSRGVGRVWSCAPCILNHQPEVVRHLRRNPEATCTELKSLLKNR